MFDSICSRRSRGRAGFVASLSVVLLAGALAADPGAATCRRGTCLPIASPTTPAPDNFLSYVVTLNSLKLISTTGKKIEVLPIPLNVDLAQTVNLQRAVDSGKVPVGTYTSAQAVIDF